MDEDAPSFDLDAIRVDTSLALPDLLRSVERQLMRSPVEVGLAFNQTGSLVLRKAGDATSIVFDRREQTLLRGCTFTHNHPGRGSFSRADLRFAADFDLLQLRAVAGRKVRVLTRPLAGWDHEAFEAELARQIQRLQRNRRDRLISLADYQGRVNRLIQSTVFSPSFTYSNATPMKALPTPLLPNGDYALRDSDAHWLRDLVADPADAQLAPAKLTAGPTGASVEDESTKPVTIPASAIRGQGHPTASTF